MSVQACRLGAGPPGKLQVLHVTLAVARLSYAQHRSETRHSPTNLIDFTESLPVALYFACTGSPDADGADGRIIVVDRTRFAQRDDIDFSLRETQSILPAFWDDNRNIHQWSHFLYPKNGYLSDDEIRRVVQIPSRYKKTVLRHLEQNCDIRAQTLFTQGGSWSESPQTGRHSRNMCLLGVTLEWIGDTDEARRIYRERGTLASPEAQIRDLELKLESVRFSSQDMCQLSSALNSKSLDLWQLATAQSSNGCSVEEAESLWMKALASLRLSRGVVGEPLGAQTLMESEIFYEIGRYKLMVGKRSSDERLIGEAIAALATALHLRPFDWDASHDLRVADFLYALADAEMNTGRPAKAAERIGSVIGDYGDHPRIGEFRRLAADAASHSPTRTEP